MAATAFLFALNRDPIKLQNSFRSTKEEASVRLPAYMDNTVGLTMPTCMILRCNRALLSVIIPILFEFGSGDNMFLLQEALQ